MTGLTVGRLPRPVGQPDTDWRPPHGAKKEAECRLVSQQRDCHWTPRLNNHFSSQSAAGISERIPVNDAARLKTGGTDKLCNSRVEPLDPKAICIDGDRSNQSAVTRIEAKSTVLVTGWGQDIG